ncbi:MAG: RidA family protein [bacterium]
MIEQINTAKAPSPGGPYSHAIKLGNLVFASGQLPTDPKSGKIVVEDIQAQTRQVLENLKSVLEAAGSSLDHTLKMTVYLIDKKRNFKKMNQVYGEYLRNKPARTTVDVSFIKEMPNKALVEMDAIACIESRED